MKVPRKRSWIRLANFCLGYYYGAQQRAFDLILGVSTKGIVSTESSMIDAGGDCYDYQGCQWLSVRRALKGLNPSGSDVFVDLGSGKGRALLIAVDFPISALLALSWTRSFLAGQREI